MKNQPSVHLCDFPNLSFIKVEKDIVEKMDIVRDICNCVFSLRKEKNIRVRMPLKSIMVYGKINLPEDYINIIKQEVNVKEIQIYNENLENVAIKDVVFNMKECGKIFGSKMKDILSTQRDGKIVFEEHCLKVGDLSISEDLYKIVYKAKNGEMIAKCNNFDILVMINTEINEDLIIEGLARDVVRIIQQTRKDKNFEISDTINTILYSKDNIFEKVIDKWCSFICEQTISRAFKLEKKVNDKFELYNVDNYSFSVEINKE